MTPKEILVGVRELLSSPRAWTKLTHVRDAHERPVRPESSQAVCFCLSGALRKVSGICQYEQTDEYRTACNLLLGSVQTCKPGWGFVAYNDRPETTHEDILFVLDRAIEEAE